MEILRSTEVLRRALVEAGPTTIFPDLQDPTGAGLDRAIEALRSALRTEPDTTSNVLRVTVTLPDPDRALRALGAVMDAYSERRVQVFADDASRLLTSELDNYNTQIRAVEETIRQVQAEFSVLDIGQEIQLAARRQDDIIQRESRVREQQALTQAQLAAAEASLLGQPGRVVASVEATNLLQGDENRNNLARLVQERERMAALYTPSFPGLVELDQRIAAARGVVREQARTTFSTTREIRNPNVEYLNQRVVALTVEVAALGRHLTELARQRQEAEGQGTGLLNAERRLRELTRQRDGLEAVTRSLITREAGTRIGSEALRQSRTGIQMVQPPTAPANGRGLRAVFLAAGMLAGCVSAGATGLLLTLTRRSFATPDEAERGLRLPVLASFGAPVGGVVLEADEIEDMVALLRDARIAARPPHQAWHRFAAGSDDPAGNRRAAWRRGSAPFNPGADL